MTDLDRRSFILGATGLAGAGALLAACGDDGSAPAEPSATADTPASGPSAAPAAVPFLVALVPDGFRSPSAFVHSVEQRLPYALHDGVDLMRDGAPSSIALEIRLGSEVITSGDITRRDVGVPTPYYPVTFTPPAAGTYTTVLTWDGEAVEHEFQVLEPGETMIPQPGDPLPAIATATVDDPRGVDPICTRVDPCPFHAINLVDALAAADKPTVLSIATPGFCQTSFCGPVIDLLIEATSDRDDLHVVHAEVYVDPHNDPGTATGTAETTEIVSAYALPFEPVLFVVDATGTILRRLDSVYDGSELAEALELING